MFEEYLQDAHEFRQIAESASAKGDERSARRYYRAAVFCLSSGTESFLNYVADSFAKAGSLPLHETAFLNDKNLSFSVDKATLVERIEYHKLDDKLKLLIRRFSPDFDLNCKMWSHLMEFKCFRDSLVHPRKGEDDTPIDDYRKKIHLGLSGVIGVMNLVSMSIFQRPLRKQLLDIAPE